jgi:hypothetical protein
MLGNARIYLGFTLWCDEAANRLALACGVLIGVVGAGRRLRGATAAAGLSRL